MGICWSDPEPPVKHVATVIPTTVPVQQYTPPPSYNPNYTYATKPPVYSNYPQQPYAQQPYAQQPYVQQPYAQTYQQPYQQQYVQQYPPQYQVYAQQPRQTMSPGAAFVGGLVLGAVAEDILDPCD